jgi:hypothetical protein
MEKLTYNGRTPLDYAQSGLRNHDEEICPRGPAAAGAVPLPSGGFLSRPV